jgi:hypothetical protein
VGTQLIHDEVADRYLLSTAKNADKAPFTRMTIIADIDGDVRFAIGARAESNNPACIVMDSSANSTSFASAFLRKSKGKNYEGMLSGDYTAGAPLHFTEHEQDPNLGSSWEFTSTLLLQRLGWVHAWSWDLATTVPVYSPDVDPPHLGKNDVLGYKDTVILGVGGATAQALVSWTKQKGVQTLLYWPSEPKGAFNPGTDGKDLVWTYGEGYTTDNPDTLGQFFDKFSVMTAPFTADPDTLKKTMRRLRSDFRGPLPDTWKVGCGYAVRNEPRPETYDTLVVVRLSDGVSWLLGSEQTLHFSWGPIYGVTCDEIVANVYLDRQEIVRIRLDSLGPGLPPD